MSSGTGSYQRTKNSLRNSVVAVGLQIVALLIGFWSRRIFLNHLGTEVLGLNTTANSILQFLNLAEMGIGGAIGVTLYKPLFENDVKKIKEVVALNGWLYKRVALFVIFGSFVLFFFFPAIFSKIQVPLWYAYASFGVYLYGALLGYFVNYKQILLSANQKEYKIQFSFKLVNIFKLVVEAFIIKYSANGFYWWLFLEVLFSTLSAVVLNININREYPYIKEKVANPNLLHKQYPDVTRKIKQILFQKIGGFVLNQFSPIIIYAFASMTLVTYYGNYTLLTVNLGLLMTALFNGLNASVGNMIVEGDKKLILKVFRELFSSRFMLVGVSCICLWFLTEPFLTLWIGPQYLLGKTTLALIIILLFLNQVRAVVDSYCYAYGLFWDIWAPLVEAGINIGLSITLGARWGLNGILTGVAASQIIMIYGWRPFLLFHWGLKESVSYYWKIFIKHLIMLILSFGILLLISNRVNCPAPDNFGQFLIYALVVFCIATFILGGLLYVSEPGQRSFINRMKNVFLTRNAS